MKTPTHPGLLKAAATLSSLGLSPEETRPAGITLRRDLLSGSHSVVTYPPLNALDRIDPPCFTELLPKKLVRGIGLYVHIPFCETVCTFCHYEVEHYNPNKSHPTDPHAAYLDILEKELDLWVPTLSGCTVVNLYIGGGTPLILSSAHLKRLFQMLRSRFSFDSKVQICVEGSPLTITAPDGLEKLQLLRELGTSRLSFGVQSFDKEVLRSAGRGYDASVAIKACELAASVFSNWNIDLIQGLSKGSLEEVAENLRVLNDVRPSHLTWYHARFAKFKWQGQLYAKKPDAFETEWEILLGRMLIWQEMAEMGYLQPDDGNRFVTKTEARDPFKEMRLKSGLSLIGFGPSSYSHLDLRHPREVVGVLSGIFFRNATPRHHYDFLVEEGRIPVEQYRPMNEKEWIISDCINGLRSAHGVSMKLLRATDLQPAMLEFLFENGLLETVGDDARMTMKGRLFEDELLATFFSDETNKRIWALETH